jgi:murein DD-endopeptidase MepM/ murein hydrolase activator NlpD
MSPENVRERKQKRRYTFIVVPDAKSQTTRTFSMSRLALIATVLSLFIVIVASIFATIIYTPLGAHLPIANPELVRQYGKQIGDIQKDLSVLMQQINVLKSYNLKLRRAMGEDVTKPDSMGFMTGSADSSMMITSVPDLQSNGNQELSPAILSEPTGMSAGFTGASAGQTGKRFSKEIPFIMPAEGLVSRVFQPDQFHFGIDVAGKQGSAVVAAADGNIVFSGWTYDDGFTIMIAHDEGFLTVYKHNQTLVKNTGETVHRGEVIALLGNTGKTSTGPHVHFEVWKNGIAQNPDNFLLNIQ